MKFDKKQLIEKIKEHILSEVDIKSTLDMSFEEKEKLALDKAEELIKDKDFIDQIMLQLQQMLDKNEDNISLFKQLADEYKATAKEKEEEKEEEAEEEGGIIDTEEEGEEGARGLGGISQMRKDLETQGGEAPAAVAPPTVAGAVAAKPDVTPPSKRDDKKIPNLRELMDKFKIWCEGDSM